MYVCVWMCVCVPLFLSLSLSLSIYLSIYLCVCACVCECVCESVSVLPTLKREKESFWYRGILRHALGCGPETSLETAV